jgi:hypothetical protein
VGKRVAFPTKRYAVKPDRSGRAMPHSLDFGTVRGRPHRSHSLVGRSVAVRGAVAVGRSSLPYAVRGRSVASLPYAVAVRFGSSLPYALNARTLRGARFGAVATL